MSRVGTMWGAAHETASWGLAVFPLRGKIPAVPKHKRACRRDGCEGCGGRGLLDATLDRAQIDRWWGTEYPGANIGVRIPEPLMVLDVDPRNGGLAGLDWLETTTGAGSDATLTSWSGRGDGGRHLWFWRPKSAGQLVPLTSKRLPAGIDLKTSTGYVVAPPSIHPDSGEPYRWGPAAPTLECSAFLADLLRADPPVPPARKAPFRPRPAGAGESPADAFTRSTTWRQVLEAEGWRCNGGDGGADGSSWLHPAATSACSASIRGGRLYVYSPNTVFEATEPGRPRGYSRFEAWAVLQHGGDMRAAARGLRRTGALS